jgi:hypothetical protein
MLGRAILEALVIITSVMVALAADRWVAGLEERAHTSELLEQLEANIRADSVRVAEALEVARTRQQVAANLLAGKGTTEGADPRRFIAEFERVGWLSQPSFETDTWRDMVATGMSSLIEDAALRKALANYYDRAEIMERLQANWAETAQIYQRRANRIVPALVRVGVLNAIPAGTSLREPGQGDVDEVVRAFETDELLRADLSQVMVSYSGQKGLYPRFLSESSTILEQLRTGR